MYRTDLTPSGMAEDHELLLASGSTSERHLSCSLCEQVRVGLKMLLAGKDPWTWSFTSHFHPAPRDLGQRACTWACISAYLLQRARGNTSVPPHLEQMYSRHHHLFWIFILSTPSPRVGLWDSETSSLYFSQKGSCWSPADGWRLEKKVLRIKAVPEGRKQNRVGMGWTPSNFCNFFVSPFKI